MTFPRAMPYALPPPDNTLYWNLSSLILIMCCVSLVSYALVHAISWHCLSSPHSLNALGSSCMLKSTSGTEPPPLLHTCDASPVKSKVAPQLTASQGVDYHSTVHTVYLSHHREGHHHRMGHHTVINTLYIVITTLVPLHLASLGGHIKKDSLQIVCPFHRIVKSNRMCPSTLFHTSRA